MNIIQRNQFIHAIEHILHVPGNYRGGILEMTVVLDTGYPMEEAKAIIKDHLSVLKQHSDLFSNVRLNLVLWDADETITNTVTSMSMLMLGRGLPSQEESQSTSGKSPELLCDYLKKFHARSKILLLFTKENYVIQEKEVLQNCLQPFLGRKLLILNGDNVMTAAEYLTPHTA
ncbi:MAG: hypothetical protein J6K26_11570 [Lachnospiraceae bacterium]|nr:hypothetical protein [Lachnospiraceae bacterium]